MSTAAGPSVPPAARRTGVWWIDLAVGLLAGAALVLAGPSPTGAAGIDAVLLLAGGVVAVWAAGRAPWWAGAIAGAAFAVAAGGPWSLAFGLAAVTVAIVVGRPAESRAWVGPAVAGLGIDAAASLRSIGGFGGSAVLGIGTVVVWCVVGMSRRSKVQRWVFAAGALAVVLLAGAAVGALAVSALDARDDVVDGRDAAERAIDQLGDGDFAGAADTFAQSAAHFDAVDASLATWWAQPARWVPGVAQNVEAAAELIAAAADSVHSVADIVATVDIDSLRLVEGRIDVDAIAALASPLESLQASLGDLDAAVEATRTDPWVVSALSDRLGSLPDDIAEQRARGDDLLRIVRDVPAMLGADGARTYLVVFVTPAQLRGGGGAIESWAEVTIDRGRIAMSGFGRVADLERAAKAARATVSGPPGWLTHWGSRGVSDADGVVVPGAWSNVNLSPDFPSTAQVIAELYPQSGGRDVDGVVSLDVEALAVFLEITGPMDVPGLEAPLTADTAVEVLLGTGAAQDPGDPVSPDVLAIVAEQTVLRLFTSTLPPPPDLADLLSPLVHEGRLQAWASRPVEQELMTQVGMDGSLPDLEGGDGFTVALANVGGPPVGAWLQGSATYAVARDPSGRGVTATATVTLTNTVPADTPPADTPPADTPPADTLPADPPPADTPPADTVPTSASAGPERLVVSIYSALAPGAATVNGTAVDATVDAELGYSVAAVVVEIPAGATVTVEVTFAGPLDQRSGYHVVARAPAIVGTFPVSVIVDGTPVIDGLTTRVGRTAT